MGGPGNSSTWPGGESEASRQKSGSLEKGRGRKRRQAWGPEPGEGAVPEAAALRPGGGPSSDGCGAFGEGSVEFVLGSPPDTSGVDDRGHVLREPHPDPQPPSAAVDPRECVAAWLHYAHKCGHGPQLAAGAEPLAQGHVVAEHHSRSHPQHTRPGQRHAGPATIAQVGPPGTRREALRDSRPGGL